MSKKFHPTDKDHLSLQKRNLKQKKSKKKTNDCHGFTEKSKKMVGTILIYC